MFVSVLSNTVSNEQVTALNGKKTVKTRLERMWPESTKSTFVWIKY